MRPGRSGIMKSEESGGKNDERKRYIQWRFFSSQ
jgi:hypothetical protein